MTEKLEKLYQAGKEVAAAGRNVDSEAFWIDVAYDADGIPQIIKDAFEAGMTDLETAFFEAGAFGHELPVRVSGWRYGDLPRNGKSWNFRDQRYERGVSMAFVDGIGDTSDGTYAMFNGTGRKKVRCSGWMIGFRGSDNEPIIVCAEAE